MATIRMNREHSLAHDQARASAEAIVVRLAEEFGVKYHWEEDTVKFRGAGAKGYMAVKPDYLDLKLELGFMLRPFKGRIEREMANYLDDFCAGKL